MGDPGAQLVNVQRRCVDHQVGGGTKRCQRLAFPADTVQQPSVALQRMRPADRLLASHDDVVGCLQEQDLWQRADRAEFGEHRRELLEEATGTYIQHHGEAGQVDLPGLPAHLG